ncbi:MAG: DNA-3-methyladenine glycosylase 2 family protein [Oscillospiraceae bacterium]|nr:DNA-3-methyladenine glycosylase 2 family protein [Oscillospiraceae bacterium]
MTIKETDFGVRISDFGGINLGLTLDCGQAFRWRRLADGAFAGVVKGKAARIAEGGGDLIFLGCGKEEFSELWHPYFGFDTDYGRILSILSRNPFLAGCIEKYGVIRILRQEPFETLCSFIISACNNIPRIKGIIERMSKKYGEEIGGGLFAFPSAETLAGLSEDELLAVGTGFRAGYIIDAAKKAASGELDFGLIKSLPVEEAKKSLMTVRGVGEKVADCVLLFGLGFMNAYPVDRHIKRITAEVYPGGLPECVKNYEGIAQQYLFVEKAGFYKNRIS